MPASKFLMFFMPKNDLFFDFWTPLDFGQEAQFFFRHFTIFFAPEKFFRFGPPHFDSPIFFLKSDATLR